MEVTSLRGLLFWLVNRASSSLLQITGSTVLFCSVGCIHGWTVIFSERINEL